MLFRRDKNFWDYNLLANPLNPAVSNPSIAIATSPHSLDLVRRMQDYNLTLLPQSRVSFVWVIREIATRAQGSSRPTAVPIPQFNQTIAIPRIPIAPAWMSASCRKRQFRLTSF